MPRGDVFAKALSVFFPWRRLRSPPYHRPPSSCSPTVPSLQLPCICGAVTVRGGLQKYSLQFCGLDLELYLLWDRLWTCQTDSYFCFPLSCSRCNWVSLHVSVHFDQLGVTVHVMFVIAPLLAGFLNISFCTLPYFNCRSPHVGQ